MNQTVQYISLAETSGYGLSAQSNMLALSDRARVLWLPLFASDRGYGDIKDEDELQYRSDKLTARYACAELFKLEPKTQQQCRHETPDVIVQHTVPELWDRYLDTASSNVAYTVWETSELPDHWPALCDRMDRILVPSQFSRDVFCRKQPDHKVIVVPHIARDIAVNPAMTNDFRSRYGIPHHHYMFYTINAWNIRKAPWLTLHAYLQAFDDKDPVSFVIKADTLGERHYNSIERDYTHKLVEQIVSNYPDPPHVCLINHEITCEDLDALHGAADCYLSLTHAEGWALGAFEAGSVGNPVIITGWGGQLDYLSEETAYLVEFQLSPVKNAIAPNSYSSNQRWANPDLDDAIDKIRWVYEHQVDGVQRGDRIKGFIDEHFRADKVGPLLLDAICV